MTKPPRKTSSKDIKQSFQLKPTKNLQVKPLSIASGQSHGDAKKIVRATDQSFQAKPFIRAAGKDTEPPGKVTEPPGKITEPLGKFMEPPSKASKPLREVAKQSF